LCENESVEIIGAGDDDGWLLVRSAVIALFIFV